jgi:hypothetical protein
MNIHIYICILDAPGDVLAAKYCAEEKKFGDKVAVSCIAVATGKHAHVSIHVYKYTYTCILYICMNSGSFIYRYDCIYRHNFIAVAIGNLLNINICTYIFMYIFLYV